MTDPIKTIGTILTGDEERDCIHIAIMPAIASEEVERGEEVGLVYGTTTHIKSMDRVYGLPSIGIVDPFLKHYLVEKGQKVWVFLFPGTVTGMRHHWQHQDIDQQKQPANESEKWLRAFANKWNFNYDDMISDAKENEGCVVAMGIDLHSAGELDPGDEELFWEHIEKLTGFKASQDHKDTFCWSCSC